ncbi:Retrovirus-related Pol polyprotein from transposon TNT 1-94 [Gossypium australe]|uniref:Retrovirus-related Pol polyprotein from transposon TNT 1-94 n=1 Tax=Gossypium australe TaxID=47621 RepID=A0A5B6WN03_9ROSI|nr:Retrovirus-related Pol polyprotein from transposon TNT 1-94 [Gossypium australe]
MNLFALVVSDLWGPASITCGNHWYYVSFIDMCTCYTWLYLIQRKSQANLSMSFWGYAFCCAVHLINRLPTSVLKGQSPFKVLHDQDPIYDHLRVFECCCFLYLCPFLFHKLDFRSQPCIFLGYSSQHKGYQCLTPDRKVILSLHVMFDENHFPFPKTVSGSSSSRPCVSIYVPIVASRPTESSLIRPDVASPPVSGSSSTLPVSVNSQDDLDSLPTDSTPLRPTSISSDPPLVPPHMGNTHSMVTHSKVRIFKPKALSVEAINCEPRTINKVFVSKEWHLAAQVEYNALINNSTWDLSPLPYGRKVIGYCSQVPGCDFKEKFSPVVKPATIRTILSVVVSKGWPLRQVNVNNDFLNRDLTDEVFTQQLPRYVQSGPNGEPLVCRLTKALYGLCQAPRVWFDKLKHFLLSVGFILSKSDASLFVNVMSAFTLYVLVYVDDIIVTGSLSDSINIFVQQLHSEFSLKDMGNLHYFLDIEVTQSSTGCLNTSTFENFLTEVP